MSNQRWRNWGVYRKFKREFVCSLQTTGEYVCNKCRTTADLTIDHKVPVSAGGDAFDLNNLQVLCHNCHKKKTRLENKTRSNSL
jgi:5-methylcytosine-specific restriction endonuclease McrA